MVQALHYLKTSFPYTTYDTLNAAPAYHFGGCLEPSHYSEVPKSIAEGIMSKRGKKED